MFKKNKKKPENRIKPEAESPAAVFSYYSSRAPLPSSRPKPDRTSSPDGHSRHWLALLPSILAGAAIVGSCLFATSLNTHAKVQINNINNSKQLLRDTAFYQKASQALLSRSIFNQSKLTIDTANVAKQLEAQYPELGNVTVIIPLVSRQPIIEVEPAQAILQLSGQGGSYIIDDQGRALAKANDARSSLRDSLPNVIDESSLEISIGKRVLPLNTIHFIGDLTSQLVAKQLVIQKMTLPAIAEELHVYVERQPYYIKFDIQGDAREQAGSYLAAKLKLDSDKPTEYIDVRVPEKVFYK